MSEALIPPPSSEASTASTQAGLTPPSEGPAAGADSTAAAAGQDTVSGGDTAAAVAGDDTTAGEAALDAVPESFDKYDLTLGDQAKEVLGDLSADPAVKALREAAFDQGWTVRQFNDRVGPVIDALAAKGLLVPNFNPAAELAKLGETGPARQQEVQVFADALKSRGDIDDAEYGELMSLQPTAAGVSLIEKLRKMAAGQGGGPGGGDLPSADTLKAEAREMRRDPRYDSDQAFRREADAKFKKAWGI